MSDAGMNGSAAGPTIPASAETLLRLQLGKAPDAEEREDLPVYLLAAPTEKLMRAYRAGLTARGLRYPTDDELESEIRVWLDDMREAPDGLAVELFERRLRDIERFNDLKADLEREAKERFAEMAEHPAEPEEPTKRERLPRDRQLIVDRYQQLRRLAADNCPGVQDLLEKRRRFSEEYPKIAARVALRGAERLDLDVIVHGHEAGDATMAALDDETQQAIGLYWLAQSVLSAAQKKTSVSPPPSPTTTTTTRKRGGKRPSAQDSVRSLDTLNGTNALSATHDT